MADFNDMVRRAYVRGFTHGAWIGFSLGGFVGIVLTIVLFACTAPAHADDTRVSVAHGTCDYVGGSYEGVWWKGTDFTTGQDTTHCTEIDVSHNAWRFGYADLGRIDINETAYGAGVGPDPHWAAYGHGDVQGVSAGTSHSWRVAGPLSISAEACAYAYTTRYYATATHYASGRVSNFAAPRRYGVAPCIGTGLTIDVGKDLALTANARYYHGIKFNQQENGGDTVGRRGANIRSLMLGIEWRY